MPTSFSEIRYYLRCPKEYQIRQSYGFNPAVPALFGYGRVVHTAIEKLHQKFPNAVPTAAEAEAVVEDSFHLKHVPPSRDPVESPGAYENAKSKAKEIASTYVERYGDDFTRQREVEARFEIPSANCVISGAIDLLLRESEEGEILGAEIIDYKTMEGGENPQENKKLDWTEMSLQVQLYSRAAKEILGENAKTGSVHLLKDNRRIEVPVTENAIASAIANVEWAVKGIIAQDFPMRPHPEKCGSCDFNAICKMLPEGFSFSSDTPPAIQLPDGKTKTISAFSLSQLNK
jgi:DNA helicase-2/ATP-dependent DNA helicase PcrA